MFYKLSISCPEYGDLDLKFKVARTMGAEKFYRSFERIEYISKLSFCGLPPFYGNRPDKEIEDQEHYFQSLMTAFENLKEECAIEPPFLVPTKLAHIDQNFLNLAHRFFTNESRINTEVPVRQFNPKIAEYTHQINDYVHLLENYIPRPNQILQRDTYHFLQCMRQDNSRNSKIVSDLESIHFNLEEREHSHARPTHHYDLILATNIHGKAVRESFLDNDNPNHWDTSGHYMSLGDLIVQNGDITRQHYTSEKFASWAKQFKRDTDSFYYDFPIGYFDSSNDKQLFKEFMDYMFVNEKSIDNIVSVIQRC